MRFTIYTSLDKDTACPLVMKFAPFYQPSHTRTHTHSRWVIVKTTRSWSVLCKQTSLRVPSLPWLPWPCVQGAPGQLHHPRWPYGWVKGHTHTHTDAPGHSHTHLLMHRRRGRERLRERTCALSRPPEVPEHEEIRMRREREGGRF